MHIVLAYIIRQLQMADFSNFTPKELHLRQDPFPPQIPKPNTREFIFSFTQTPSTVFLITRSLSLIVLETRGKVRQIKQTTIRLPDDEYILQLLPNDIEQSIIILTSSFRLIVLEFSMVDFHYEALLDQNIKHNFIKEINLLRFNRKVIYLVLDSHVYFFDLTLCISHKSKVIIKDIFLKVTSIEEAIHSLVISPEGSHIAVFSNQKVYLFDNLSIMSSEVIHDLGSSENSKQSGLSNGVFFKEFLFFSFGFNFIRGFNLLNPKASYTVKLPRSKKFGELAISKLVHVDLEFFIATNSAYDEVYFLGKDFKTRHKEVLYNRLNTFLVTEACFFIIWMASDCLVKYKRLQLRLDECLIEKGNQGSLIESFLSLESLEREFTCVEKELIGIKASLKSLRRKIGFLLNELNKTSNRERFMTITMSIQKEIQLLYELKERRYLKEGMEQPYCEFPFNSIYTKVVQFYVFKFGSEMIRKEYNIYRSYFREEFTSAKNYLLSLCYRTECPSIYNLIKRLNE